MDQFRQGDVFFQATEESIPTEAQPVARDAGRVILAYGEVTGHAHAVLDPDVELRSVGDQVDRWLRVGAGGATVRHEEHGAITLAPGTYRVRIQREWTDEDEPRRVVD
jgi:hypothetical protein